MNHRIEMTVEDHFGAVLVCGEVMEDPGDRWTPPDIEARIESITDEDGGDVDLPSDEIELIRQKMLAYCGIYH